MIKPIAIATMMLVLAAAPGLAQAVPSPATQRASVLGQTGTMSDGNNANLKLPPEQNEYWARLWAQPRGSANSGPGSAVGAGASGTSLGITTGGGEH
jgi:hypothetical protein